MAMEDIMSKRFAPLNFSAMVGYPHPVPQIDEWQDLLPRFYEDENDSPLEHVLGFHDLMQQLDIQHKEIHISCLCTLFNELLVFGITLSSFLTFLH
jgi:hypothetical protein